MASLAVVLHMDDSSLTEHLKQKYADGDDHEAAGDIVITLHLEDDTIRVKDDVDFADQQPEISLEVQEKLFGRIMVQFAEHVAARVCEETDTEWRKFDDDDQAVADLDPETGDRMANELTRRDNVNAQNKGKYRIPTVETF